MSKKPKKQISKQKIIIKQELVIIVFLLVLSFLLTSIPYFNEAGITTDLKETACDAAERGGTCNTKLESLGLVLKEDCCQLFGKCCG